MCFDLNKDYLNVCLLHLNGQSYREKMISEKVCVFGIVFASMPIMHYPHMEVNLSASTLRSRGQDLHNLDIKNLAFSWKFRQCVSTSATIFSHLPSGLCGASFNSPSLWCQGETKRTPA